MWLAVSQSLPLHIPYAQKCYWVKVSGLDSAWVALVILSGTSTGIEAKNFTHGLLHTHKWLQKSLEDWVLQYTWQSSKISKKCLAWPQILVYIWNICVLVKNEVWMNIWFWLCVILSFWLCLMMELRISLSEILLLNVDSGRSGPHPVALHYWHKGMMTVNIRYLLALG